uniref:Nucleotid_trans domain-containing protein n=1 Tax=Schistocephalus solidus TaxID=70667 RepID=A0A183T6C3_SCHSO
LDTDDSDRVIKAALSQLTSDIGEKNIMHHASKDVSLGVGSYVFWPKHLGVHFVTRIDHNALQCLQMFRNPKGQEERWQVQLHEYHLNNSGMRANARRSSFSPAIFMASFPSGYGVLLHGLHDGKSVAATVLNVWVTRYRAPVIKRFHEARRSSATSWPNYAPFYKSEKQGILPITQRATDLLNGRTKP